MVNRKFPARILARRFLDDASKPFVISIHRRVSQKRGASTCAAAATATATASTTATRPSSACNPPDFFSVNNLCTAKEEDEEQKEEDQAEEKEEDEAGDKEEANKEKEEDETEDKKGRRRMRMGGRAYVCCSCRVKMFPSVFDFRG